MGASWLSLEFLTIVSINVLLCYKGFLNVLLCPPTYWCYHVPYVCVEVSVGPTGPLSSLVSIFLSPPKRKRRERETGATLFTASQPPSKQASKDGRLDHDASPRSARPGFLPISPRYSQTYMYVRAVWCHHHKHVILPYVVNISNEHHEKSRISRSIYCIGYMLVIMICCIPQRSF